MVLEERKNPDPGISAQKFYDRALYFWKAGDKERAFYYLGGALYFLQCQFTTSEALSLLTKSVESRKKDFSIQGGGNYVSEPISAREWVQRTNEQNAGWREALTGKDGETQGAGTEKAAIALSRGAQINTAGLLARFFQDVGEI
ncbi:MAG: hypothetical protein HYU64_03125 [Armatimonadetes bacterium]|nr:hypothetical protein [Armatimonadota bacterium]